VRLRRFAEHLRQQHWTAAVIELVIVVLGVFIGLQVSNWNEARRDRALAHQYLERLREDFVLSTSGAESSIAFLEQQAGLAGLMLERLRECRLDGGQRADFGRGLYMLGRLEPPLLTRGTVDELRSTGRIGIIRNVRLRQAIADIVQRHERTAEVFGFVVARRTQPLAYVDARSTFLVPVSNAGDPEPGQVLFDFPALCGDPAYINNVSHLRAGVHVAIRQNRRLLTGYRAILQQLDAELAKEPG
jgi:hypothetical protein